MTLTVGSLFSGIGGLDLGLHLANLDVRWQCEIVPRAREVLKNHFPESVIFDDVKTIPLSDDLRVDVIVGGFPCQDVSVCGSRSGVNKGSKSNLFFEMMRIVDVLQPSYVLWENVPGILSGFDEIEIEKGVCNCGWSGITNNNERSITYSPLCKLCGRAISGTTVELVRKPWMCSLLGRLHELGYSGAWTTLDARWFGLAQQRQRVFGLFARHGRRLARPEEVFALGDRLSWTVRTDCAKRSFVERWSRTDSHEPGKGSQKARRQKKTQKSESSNQRDEISEDSVSVIGIEQNQRNEIRVKDVSGCVKAQPGVRNQTYIISGNSKKISSINPTQVSSTLIACNPSRRVAQSSTVVVLNNEKLRKFTPTESLRLQGFPDDWLDNDPEFPDTFKYEGIGNAVAVPVSMWIGDRLSRLHEKVTN